MEQGTVSSADMSGGANEILAQKKAYYLKSN